MKDLGITKGDWEVEEYHDGDLLGLRVVSNYECVTMFDTGVCGWISEEEEANAKLIADAGNTANKYGLLPSELLEQRYDLAEALKHALEIMYQCEPPKELFETYANAYANYHNLIQDINYDNPAT